MTRTPDLSDEKLWPWINRILLAVAAFFIMDFHSDFKEFAKKVESALLTQAELRIQIQRNQQDIFEMRKSIIQLQDVQSKYEKDRSDFYRDYGYMFKKQNQ